MTRPELRISSSVFRQNIAAVRDRIAPSTLMLVLKDDAYGHGLLWAVETAQQAGVEWFGSYDIRSALEVRRIAGEDDRMRWLFADRPQQRRDDRRSVVEPAAPPHDPQVQPARDTLREPVTRPPAERLRGQMDVAEVNQTDRLHIAKLGARSAELQSIIVASVRAVDCPRSALRVPRSELLP